MAWENLPSTNTPLNATNLNQFEKYLSTETVIGTWVTGKPLYRKVVSFGALPNNTSKDVAHNISNLGFISRLSGVGYRSSGNIYFPLPYSDPISIGNAILLNVSGSNIRVTTATDRSNVDAYIIIEYTKTTD